jgi:hypothetical protein
VYAALSRGWLDIRSKEHAALSVQQAAPADACARFSSARGQKFTV